MGKLTVGVKWMPLEDAVNIPIHRHSPLANPFPINAGRSREEACEMYEDYLMEMLNRGDKVIHEALNQIMTLLAEGKNVHLTCFCKGKGYENRQCHGDFIKEVIEDAIVHQAID